MNDVSLNIASESADVIANRLVNKAEYRAAIAPSRSTPRLYEQRSPKQSFSYVFP